MASNDFVQSLGERVITSMVNNSMPAPQALGAMGPVQHQPMPFGPVGQPMQHPMNGPMYTPMAPMAGNQMQPGPWATQPLMQPPQRYSAMGGAMQRGTCRNTGLLPENCPCGGAWCTAKKNQAAGSSMGPRGPSLHDKFDKLITALTPAAAPAPALMPPPTQAMMPPPPPPAAGAAPPPSTPVNALIPLQQQAVVPLTGPSPGGPAAGAIEPTTSEAPLWAVALEGRLAGALDAGMDKCQKVAEAARDAAQEAKSMARFLKERSDAQQKEMAARMAAVEARAAAAEAKASAASQPPEWQAPLMEAMAKRLDKLEKKEGSSKWADMARNARLATLEHDVAAMGRRRPCVIPIADEEEAGEEAGEEGAAEEAAEEAAPQELGGEEEEEDNGAGAVPPAARRPRRTPATAPRPSPTDEPAAKKRKAKGSKGTPS